MEISGKTRVLGLIADPVAQARSPAMANELLRRQGRYGDFALVPLHTPAARLPEVVAAVRGIENFAGAIVSMPHKEAILPHLDALSDAARLVGAVNVVARDAAGRLRGDILDGEGFVEGLRAAGHEVAGLRCLLAGAGGAAAAIAFSLAAHGCRSLNIRNRTAARAESLAARVAGAYPNTRVATLADDDPYDLAVNATSLGMRSDDALPFSAEEVARCRVVADCVASPEDTALLQLARRSGRHAHGGGAMLAAQMQLLLRFMGVGAA